MTLDKLIDILHGYDNGAVPREVALAAVREWLQVMEDES